MFNPSSSSSKSVSSVEIPKLTTISIPVSEYRSQPIPGFEGTAKLGECFVRVTDMPNTFDSFMEVNPRVPNRTKSGLLSGPVAKGILTTLRDNPEEMALKNQGIYLLVEEANFQKAAGGKGMLAITLSNSAKHGIVNGSHTYAAIREAIENVQDGELNTLARAFVRLHVFQGIGEDLVAQIAEGLNRSKQVDDPSLANLQGHFETIQKVMKGKPGETAIAYHQGDNGEIYISEILVYLAFFNCDRYNDKKHPHQLYRKQSLALKYFAADIEANPSPKKGLIDKLPDVLWLVDSIKKMTPEAARNNSFQFGRLKTSEGARAGAKRHKGSTLPFINDSIDYRIPNGWVYPMLAAFRANAKWDTSTKKLEWKEPLKTILPNVIDDLVGVCVTEHRDNNMRPELIGNRESAYRQCYDKIQLYLAKKGLL